MRISKLTAIAAFEFCRLAFAEAAAEAWLHRYNGAANSNDIAKAVAIDTFGNVIVTGSSHNGTNFDFYTAKYAFANGALLWEKRYNGSANSNEEAIAVAVDGNDNVIVMGQSHNGMNDDFYTAKYAAADGAVLQRARQWTRLRAGFGARSFRECRRDRLFAKSTRGESDFYTAKYAGADGALLWEQRFGGDDEYGGSGAAIAISSNGNVAVTGSYERSRSSFHTEVYAADGALLWAKEYFGLGPLFDSHPHAIAFDGDGNVVVTGESDGLNGESDYYTAKYAAADGALLWEQRHDGPLHNDDSSRALAVDKDGNVFVTGAQDYDAIETASYYTVKYAAVDGVLLWEQTYQSFSEDEGDHAMAIAIDVAGDAIVTGKSGLYDAATIKYRGRDGTILWKTRTSYEEVGRYTPSGLALGPHGMVAITGFFSFFDAAGSRSDYLTTVYRESISIEPVLPGVRLRFTGTPGQSYNIQRAPTVTGPWSTNATLVAPLNGIIEYVDTNAPPGSAFYRTSTP